MITAEQAEARLEQLETEAINIFDEIARDPTWPDELHAAAVEAILDLRVING